ncbi:MAG: GNAT family N-acetyltransferase [Defluviimonas denitrificans]
MIPRIETDRLILRGYVRDDFEDYVALRRTPRLPVHREAWPRKASDIWGRFLGIAGNWAIEGFGQWAVIRRADGRLIGQTGIFRAMRGLGAEFDAAPEAGWILTGAAHGQGYGGEAVDAAHRWFDASPHAGPLHAMIEPENAASFRIAERFGYLRSREAEYEGAAVVLMRRPAQR